MGSRSLARDLSSSQSFCLLGGRAFWKPHVAQCPPSAAQRASTASPKSAGEGRPQRSKASRMVTLGSSYSAKLGCLGSYTFFALFLSFLLLLSEIPLPLRRMLSPHAISVNSLLITSVIRSRNRASKWCGDASYFLQLAGSCCHVSLHRHAQREMTQPAGGALLTSQKPLFFLSPPHSHGCF